MNNTNTKNLSASARENVGLLLWQATNQWQRAHREVLTPLKLTLTQYIVLEGVNVLSRRGVTVSQNAVAQATKTDAMMTSQVVRTLVEKKWLKREDDPSDKRAFRLSLTQKGKEILLEAAKRVEKTEQHFFSNLGKTSDTFVQALQRLAAKEIAV